MGNEVYMAVADDFLVKKLPRTTPDDLRVLIEAVLSDKSDCRHVGPEGVEQADGKSRIQLSLESVAERATIGDLKSLSLLLDRLYGKAPVCVDVAVGKDYTQFLDTLVSAGIDE